MIVMLVLGAFWILAGATEFLACPGLRHRASQERKLGPTLTTAVATTPADREYRTGVAFAGQSLERRGEAALLSLTLTTDHPSTGIPGGRRGVDTDAPEPSSTAQPPPAAFAILNPISRARNIGQPIG